MQSSLNFDFRLKYIARESEGLAFTLASGFEYLGPRDDSLGNEESQLIVRR